MTAQNKTDRPDLKFIKADATNMSEFADGQFTVVLDKGTLDAILVDESDATLAMTRSYWQEIDRVLKNGGRYVVVSLLQEHILKALLLRFPPNNWMFRVVRCTEAENKNYSDKEDSVQMPVFMVVATKLQKLPMRVLEICTVGEKIVRVDTIEDIHHEISILQRAAIAMNGLKRTNISGNTKVPVMGDTEACFAGGGGIVGRKMSLVGALYFRDVVNPSANTDFRAVRTFPAIESGEIDFCFYTGLEDKEPRYRTYTLDQPPKRDYHPYAAFLIPQGR